jgi:hypothetical protein
MCVFDAVNGILYGEIAAPLSPELPHVKLSSLPGTLNYTNSKCQWLNTEQSIKVQEERYKFFLASGILEYPF